MLALGLVSYACPATALQSDEERAAALVARMTLDEKIGLVHTRFGTPTHGHPAPPGALGSAGFAAGIPRLGIPPLQESDAGLGIADPTNKPMETTALPSALAMAASFDPGLAEATGRALGAEARDLGFSVLLGGGANLVREARDGRAFEYAGEDALLTGAVVGAAVRGIESQGVIATLKHFALNDQENGRVVYDARLDEASARESDLLAFELAMEQGRPGAVLTSYNRVNGIYASENPHLLTDVLKSDWSFPGWIMSDWGGTHSTVAAACAGLDQQSGVEDDPEVFFGDALKNAVVEGRVPLARLDDMVRRVLRARIETGQLDRSVPAPGRLDPDQREAHAATVQRAAEEGIVLLKNDGNVLPLRSPHRVLVVGSHADKGVLSGGGSSQVVPTGALRFEGEPARLFFGKPKLYDPSSPLDALRRALPQSAVSFNDGSDLTSAVRQAMAADVAIVFAEQWSDESLDSPDLSLPHRQDDLIAAVARANPRTLVVLETGQAVAMPWLPAVPGVLEAWYPGARGGPAIADVLLGRVDASGRLPITFPVSTAQLPRPVLPDHSKSPSSPGDPIKGPPFAVNYDVEGADAGYRWYVRKGLKPLFPFGYGLSYTRFAFSHLTVKAGGVGVSASFDVSNIGGRSGDAMPQLYVDAPAHARRLVGWQRVSLPTGASRHATLTIDPRLLARFDVAADAWRIVAGDYTLSLRADVSSEGTDVHFHLDEHTWSARHG